MKKVFVSIPLKGRSKEEIQESLDKAKEAVKGLLDEDVELLHQDPKDIPDFEEGKDDAREALKFLSKDLELMADADYFVTIEENWDYRHCSVEQDIFRKYFTDGKWEHEKDNMISFSANIICPDVVKKERERAKKLWGEKALKDEVPEIVESAIEDKKD